MTEILFASTFTIILSMMNYTRYLMDIYYLYRYLFTGILLATRLSLHVGNICGMMSLVHIIQHIFLFYDSETLLHFISMFKYLILDITHSVYCLCSMISFYNLYVCYYSTVSIFLYYLCHIFSLCPFRYTNGTFQRLGKCCIRKVILFT